MVAAQLLEKSADLGENAAWEAYQTRSRMVKGRLLELDGDLEGALEFYDESERVATPSVLPDFKPISAMKSRVWTMQGRLSDAIRWADERNLTVENELTYLHEYEHVTLAKILIARYKAEGGDQLIFDALGFLDRLLEAAESGGRFGVAIEILVQQAVAEAARGEIDQALKPLRRALAMGEPESYVRVFTVGGKDMENLLTTAAERGYSVPYTQRLLAYFDNPSNIQQAKPSSPGITLPEQLTVRELEVLRLVATGLTNQEIADHLFISVSTVKRHIANTYGKLGSSNRTQAVKLAEELELL